ncbi:receptor-type tyrosine-protein phosphatase kappa-like [Palaemon carinicauda]|uniref:receptor-type tyrosine-protein phosphatase kappa-like n=1 Tax=Palaemon carinicauda TaxID=392227 RepID=UPI0035B64DD3
MKTFSAGSQLLAAPMILALTSLAASNPMLAPTSSWPFKNRNEDSDAGEEYQRGNLGNIPRSLGFPSPARSEDRYNARKSRRQYQYGAYQHHNLDTNSHSLDYDLDPSYQHEVNIYEYSYTESTNYKDQNKKYNPGSIHHFSGSGGAGGGGVGGGSSGGRMSRRFGDRGWWRPISLSAMGHGESFIGRSVGPQHLERPLNSPNGEEPARYLYSVPQNNNLSGTDHRVTNNGGDIVVQNDSLIGMVRVQKSLQSSREVHRRDFAIVQAIEPTTVQPGSPKPKQRGFESLLKMLTEADDKEDAKSNTILSVRYHPERKDTLKLHSQGNTNYNSYTLSNNEKISDKDNNRNLSNQETNINILTSNSKSSNITNVTRSDDVAEMEKVEHLPRVGEAQQPSAPVTTTAVLGSIMLLIIILMVMVALRVQWRERVKDAEDWGGVRSPSVQPPTPAATSSGLPSSPGHHLDPLNHLQPEPIRIKAKGLLERRGSNTSLTLELAPNCPPPEVTSPPRHCTPEEFLMTAGNRMSRRELRNCLRNTRALHAEFWEVPLNHPDKCDVPGSGAKNRYRTVLPNEVTRVHLNNGDPAKDYINANYVRGYDGEEKTYIVTQGPLAHTVVDLWTLVMQEKSPAVVMITRLKEKRRVKCEPYIPTLSATYGDITVTVKQLIHKHGYTIRQILLQRGDVTHETLHFWYTTWPDHKTPTEADQLLAMALEVDHVRKSSETGIRGPVVVHCSAGIGRSGCFVAISIAINQLLEEDCVDILGILCQMRLDRGGMVQTGEQYEFIHRAVALYEETLPVVCSGK